MNTSSANSQLAGVGGSNRPPFRPRGEGVCVGGYYVDAAHPPSPTLGDVGVGDAPTAHVNPFYQRASQRLIERGYKGGQHATPKPDP